MSQELLEKLRAVKTGVRSQESAASKGGQLPGLMPEVQTEVKAAGQESGVRSPESGVKTPEAGQSFRIQEINGLHDFTVTLDKPGVYVARGPNGAGKSSLIEAIKGASGDDKAKVEPTEGEAKGQVDMGGGVLFKVGNKRTSKGQPFVRLVSTGAIGQLIDPGLIDEKAAARARIRALVQLKPMPVDDSTRTELTGNDEELQAWIRRDTSSDAMELSHNVRLKANELALELEKRVAECEGEEKSLLGLIEELGELDYEAGDGATARTQANRANGEAQVKLNTARERAELERQQQELKNTIGERPDSSGASADVELLAKVMADLEKKLSEAQQKYQHAVRERVRLDEAARKWDAQAEIMKRPVKGPTMAEAEQAIVEAQALSARAERAEKLDRARAWLEKIDAAKIEATTKGERAKLLRGIAQGTEEALSRLLERRGLKDLAVVEGRLHWKKDGKLLDYGSPMVSFGQRVRVALGVALEGIDRDSVESRTTGNRLPLLPLNPDFWLALDPERKAEVAAIAKERGVCLITEEPGEGELRVEQV